MKSAWSGEARLPTAEGAERTRAVLEVVQRPHIPLLIGGHGVASTLGTEPDLVRTTPLTLIGSVPEIVAKLVATREQLGISYVVVFDTAIDEMGPVLTQLAGT